MRPSIRASTAWLLGATLWWICAGAVLAADKAPNRPIDLTGRWQDVSARRDDEINAIEFKPDGRVILFSPSGRIPEAEDDAVMVYQLDTSHTPAWLDVLVALPDGTRVPMQRLIIEFVTPDSFRLGVLEDFSVRPDHFEAPGINVLGPMRRVKPSRSRR